jgi:hypothetical protein
MEATDEEWDESLVALLQSDARSALLLAYDVKLRPLRGSVKPG